MSEEQPQHQHDCDQCVFMGRFHFEGPLSTGKTLSVDSDLWICPNGVLGPSCIVRHSSEGPEYGSYPAELLAKTRESMIAHPSTYSPGVIECFTRGLKHERFKSQFEAFVSKHKR